MITSKYKLIVFLLVCTLLLAACGKKIENPLNWKINSFSYMDQNEKKFGLKDLKGKIWVANFVFTSCTTVCPPMTAHLSNLQDKLEKEDINNVEFVSFSVDPNHDKPGAIKEYMNRFDMDQSKWHFLTGYTQDEIEFFARNNFQTVIDKPEGTDQVTHGTRFYLVDEKGTVIKNYEGVSNFPYDKIVEDIKILQDS
ncbi:SCO family protein [Priestia megaterium]|uniref:SCO family protein n=1 Tax=Priestia megaterium TaxID=1404 RepID=UPI000BFE2CB0|nr:SCO family protein [Priestia megaterium]MBW0934205.1 SCO family protein [Priestia megaterium]PGX80595.1 cytochrome c oxidase assembly protein [Priestia megaterium]